jgi:hypothetical protein
MFNQNEINKTRNKRKKTTIRTHDGTFQWTKPKRLPQKELLNRGNDAMSASQIDLMSVSPFWRCPRGVHSNHFRSVKQTH